MLDVVGVTKLFGQKAAVDNISFSVDRPAFVGIIGVRVRASPHSCG